MDILTYTLKYTIQISRLPLNLYSPNRNTETLGLRITAYIPYMHVRQVPPFSAGATELYIKDSNFISVESPQNLK